MYGLSTEDLAIQTRARGFADELIPFEEQAEAAGGELPADLTAGHAKRARELFQNAAGLNNFIYTIQYLTCVHPLNIKLDVHGVNDVLVASTGRVG